MITELLPQNPLARSDDLHSFLFHRPLSRKSVRSEVPPVPNVDLFRGIIDHDNDMVGSGSMTCHKVSGTRSVRSYPGGWHVSPEGVYVSRWQGA